MELPTLNQARDTVLAQYVMRELLIGEEGALLRTQIHVKVNGLSNSTYTAVVRRIFF